MSDEQVSPNVVAAPVTETVAAAPSPAIDVAVPEGEQKQAERIPDGIATKDGKKIIPYGIFERERKLRQEAVATAERVQGERQAEVRSLHQEIERREAMLAQYRTKSPESTDVPASSIPPQAPQFKPLDVAKLKENYGDELADAFKAQEERLQYYEKLVANSTKTADLPPEVKEELAYLRQEAGYRKQLYAEEQNRLADEAKMNNPALVEWEAMPDKHPGKFGRAVELDRILGQSDRAYLSKPHAKRFELIQKIVEMEYGEPNASIDPMSMFNSASSTPMSSSDLGASGRINSNDPLAGKSGIALLNAMTKMPANQRFAVAREAASRQTTNGVRS